MTTVARSMKVTLLLLVSMMIYSSALGNQLVVICKSSTNCGQCCSLARYKCNKLCPTYPKPCPVFRNYDPCYVHKDNKSYMNFFKSKGCERFCKREIGREVQSDDPYIFPDTAQSPAPYVVENGGEIDTFYR